MKFGESRRPQLTQPRESETARVLPFWPQRWRIVFGEAHEPAVLVPANASAATRVSLSHFVRNPLKALYVRMLLKASEIVPGTVSLRETDLPRHVRAALSFGLPIAGPWQACIRMSGATRPPIACVLVTSESGEPLVYAKVATLPSADAVVQAEAHALECVAAGPGLAEQIPQLLRAGKVCNGRRYLVTRVAPTTRTSRTLTVAHIRFLTQLARTAEEVRPFRASPLKRQLSRGLLRLEPCLERSRLAAFRSAFETCASTLDGWEGPFVYAHGDFKPDNVRQGRDGLFVLDWAHARGGANPLADLLHFELAPRSAGAEPLTIRALRRALRIAERSAAQIHPDWSWSSPVVSALGLAYLVEALLERCLERRCFDPADPLVRAYWTLINTCGEWFPPPRPAFHRMFRRVYY